MNRDDWTWYVMGMQSGQAPLAAPVFDGLHPTPLIEDWRWPLDDDLSRYSDMALTFLGSADPGVSLRERERRARVVATERLRRTQARHREALDRERVFLAARQAHLRAAAQAKRRAFWARLRGVFRRATSSGSRAKG